MYPERSVIIKMLVTLNIQKPKHIVKPKWSRRY